MSAPDMPAPQRPGPRPLDELPEHLLDALADWIIRVRLSCIARGQPDPLAPPPSTTAPPDASPDAGRARRPA